MTTEEPSKCCNFPMDRSEVSDQVSYLYRWNGTEWYEIDHEDTGEVTVMFVCRECGRQEIEND